MIVSRINSVSSHEEYAQWCCNVESEVQDPWNRSEVGLICSSAEDEETECGKFRELRMAAVCQSVWCQNLN
jgi:hypothetical protein